MIIQKVIKGINNINRNDVMQIFHNGIICKWWQQVDPLPNNEIPQRLTERNLIWHQNYYDREDPDEGGNPFNIKTPFISTTAGTVERDNILRTNILEPAWLQALRFATDIWRSDGYLFYCYVFIIGKKAIGHRYFAEELRELNIYTGFSPFHPEGENCAKIDIPTTQIEKAELWSIEQFMEDLNAGRIPQPADIISNQYYLPSEDYSNVRDVLS